MLIVEHDAHAWSVVTNVHAAAGVSGWHQMVAGRTLRGAWEAVELARLPPGATSGRHRHTRTHELYYVLSGEGDYLGDVGDRPLPAGWLAVRPSGGVHGLRNTGPHDLVWLVVEAPDPSVQSPIPHPRGGNVVNREAGPVDLDRAGHLDLSPYGVEPLQETGVDAVPAQQVRDLAAGAGEFFGYLLDGAGLVTSGEQTLTVTAGTGLTLTQGERAVFTATEPARLFWVRSTVPGVLQ